MTTPALQVLQNMAKIRLPGALDDGINLELAATLTEFFDRTNVWQEEVSIAVEADVTDYTISPSDGLVKRLMNVVTDDDIPVSALLKMPDTLELRFAPSQTDTYVATVALTSDAARPLAVPDWLFSTYQLELLDGVLGRMMAQPAKPYSNQTLSVFHMRKFDAGVSNARSATRHGNGYGRQTWRYPQH